MRLRISEAAAHSILEQADYFRETVDDPLAIRWETAVDQAVQSLLSFPERGAPCRLESPDLAGIRWIFVPGFSKHMVFYRYLSGEDEILIVQVLYARAISRCFWKKAESFPDKPALISPFKLDRL
jgi:plasmid stabilization system protein ParE